jgi:hypothetical protein
LTQSACLAAVDVDEGRRGKCGGGESEDSGPGDGGVGRWLWIRDLGTQKNIDRPHRNNRKLTRTSINNKMNKKICLKTE